MLIFPDIKTPVLNKFAFFLSPTDGVYVFVQII